MANEVSSEAKGTRASPGYEGCGRVELQRDIDGVESAEDATFGEYSPSVIGPLMTVEASPESGTLDVNAQDGGEIVNSGSCGEVLDEMAQGSECDAFQGYPSIEDEGFELPSSAVPGTPLARLDAAYARCMRGSAEELDLEPAVYIREGSELMSELKDQLVMLPDLDDRSPECDIEAADIGKPGESTEAQEKQLKAVLKRHQKIFLGDGNAAPPPASGVICDFYLGDANPIAQRPRSVGPPLAIKVYKLLKKLLEATLIEHSESPWASPIVIVLKKNGVDVRMCIDYQVVNSFIQLSNYPLSLIDDLITGFEGMMWFMSLDMASGFWTVRMTERAKLISAFT
ncbi:reverse transcriptase [Phytophthora megakarya]|uniref:Reverse transcriptase n=1 Tax=Phytophthora megakarya TaxID=4795 RepID=A0A225W9H4_9STRA|nr:reverse transcriptase [Phytophthora megakarya]